MKLRTIYLLFCFLGILLPYSKFIPFLLTNGLNLSLFSQQMFGNYIASFFSLDVLISSVVVWIFAYVEGRHLDIKNWWLAIVANLLVGVSLALPLFLYMRQPKVDNK